MKMFFVMIIFLFAAPAFSLSLAEIQEAYQKSYQYEKTQDYEKAINVLSAVYREYPKTYTVNLRIGWLYYLKKNYANAMENYNAAIKAAPDSIEAALGYTLPLMAQGKFGDVEILTYQIIRRDFYNYYGNLRLALSLRMNKKYDLAQKISYKMLELYPTDTYFLVELAMAKISTNEKKDINDAYSIFADVLTLDPENLTAKYYLNK